MSGSPKFSEAEIAEWKQKILTAERRRRAEIEAKSRQEAEEQERVRQLEESRAQIQIRVNTILSYLHWQSANIYIQEAVTLQNRAANQQMLIALAESEIQLLEISEELVKIELGFQEALQRKRRDDEEKRIRADIERQQFELAELERKVAQISDAEAMKFDAAGRQQVRRVFQIVRDAIASQDPAAVRRPLTEATALVQKHLRQLLQGQRGSRHLQAQAFRQLADLQAMIAGLKADPVVMRWQAPAISQLTAEINAAQKAISDGWVQQEIAQLSEYRQRSQTIIETANAAQMQAERRDYIADSIARTLEEMGFNITFHQAEHPEHPASAIVLGAATNTGKGISVSVPIAGQVFYDVDGYLKESITSVDGNAAAVCDEAEQVLTEMHEALEEKFGVKMDEVLWEGKAPKRILRQANQLPKQDKARDRSL